MWCTVRQWLRSERKWICSIRSCVLFNRIACYPFSQTEDIHEFVWVITRKKTPKKPVSQALSSKKNNQIGYTHRTRDWKQKVMRGKNKPIRKRNREEAQRRQRLVKIILLFCFYPTRPTQLFPRLPLHQVGPVTLAQREGWSEVRREVGGLLDGLEDGLINSLLVGWAGFWEGLLL